MNQSRSRRRKAVQVLSRIPFLPSLLTLGNAFCGFLAIVYIIDASGIYGKTGEMTPHVLERVSICGFLIILAMIFDALDGKVARLTDSATDFGAQLDSLSDCLTFGAAPAVMAKFLIDTSGTLNPHPKLYYLCAALFALCAVLRLARFNVTTTGLDEESHREFVGLPTPAAAALVVSLILFYCNKFESQGSFFFRADSIWVYDWVIYSMPVVLLVSGLLMVSTFPYPHLLNTLLKRRQSFQSLSLAVFLLILFTLAWNEILIVGCLIYLATGPCLATYRFLFGGSDDEKGEDYDSGEHESVEHEEDNGEGTRGPVSGPGSMRIS